jgi:hypothetical protein
MDQIPRSPAGLAAPGRRLWRAVHAKYSLSGPEVEVLAAACHFADRADAAAEVLKADGMTTADRYGTVRPHPMLAEERNARLSMARLLRQLGAVVPPSLNTGKARPGPSYRAQLRTGGQ